MELAEKYMAEDYLQHNPNISTGRAAASPHSVTCSLRPPASSE